MSGFRIGFIGTGKKPIKAGPQGYGMAHQHAVAYQALSDCEIIACADIVEENARAFAAMFDVPRVYTSHHEMLEKEQLDVVSICTWPHLHADLTIEAAAAGVKAIHCEKPMALTWGDCKRMAAACEKRGVRLTFNHQRRFGAPFRKAKALLDEGAVGDLVRVEFGAGNLFDYGSHNFDMIGYFNNECAAEWAIGQIDYRDANKVFGAHNENQAFALWKYTNGVFGLASTGLGAAMVGCHHKIIGTEGIIEIGNTALAVPGDPGANVLRVCRSLTPGPCEARSSKSPGDVLATSFGSPAIESLEPAYVSRAGEGSRPDTSSPSPASESLEPTYVSRAGEGSRGEGWEDLDCGDEGLHGPGYIERAIADIVGALRDGRESELCARNALKATEIIFACWESARRRCRVELPLTIEDNPLEAMVAQEELKPRANA